MLIRNPPGISASCLVCVGERCGILTSIFLHCELKNNTCSTEKFSVTECKQFYLFFPRKVGSYVVLKLENVSKLFLRVSRTTSLIGCIRRNVFWCENSHAPTPNFPPLSPWRENTRGSAVVFRAKNSPRLCNFQNGNVSILSLKVSPLSLKFQNA